MALSTSPRKVVPLASGDDWKPHPKSSVNPGITQRVFFCGVVVEGSENGRQLPEDVQELVLSLGDPLSSEAAPDILSNPSSDITDSPTTDRVTQRKRAMTDSSALASVINELVTTERSYVKRLQILKHDYADPLRKFSRSKDTAIIPSYEAKTLFGNIDNLLPVNEAFLTDLEKMMAPNGAKTVGGIGDVALRHFKDYRGFEHYTQYYLKREEAQMIFERETLKRSSGFAAFIDRIKYSSADIKNRVGLRELLMDPVQRIPRYTLLFRTMIKHMAPGDPQRAKIIEADEIASKIASAKPDDQTKRAAIWACLSATVDGLPPALISNSRRFIDCIDVEDILSNTTLPSTASGSSSSVGSLHCSLFLFDDKLMIVKRPANGEKGAKALTGLDDLEKLIQAGGLPTGKKKSGLSCKGVVDVTDVVATSVGGADMHLYLENPPQDQTERWSGRPFRSLAVVNPPSPVNLDPTQTEADKGSFLEKLWTVQAMYRAKAGQSVVLRADEREVESKGGRVTLARTYFNVYQRTAFLQEPKKTKVVVHIDALGSADPIPFGVESPPFVAIRVQPMAGELSRYTVTSSDPSDEGEEDIVQTARVPARIVQTIHQYGLFKFRTGNNSLPSTPTASLRSRAAIFGLDAISRNLFNARPGSSRGDFFGGSISSHTRSKSTASRSSMYTTTTTTGDGSQARFSHRSNSTTTAATTISSMDNESLLPVRSFSKSRKLFRRGRSPGGANAEGITASPTRNSSRSNATSISQSRSASSERGSDYSDFEDDDGTVLTHVGPMDESERDLAMRLELARQNSHSQYEQQTAIVSPEKQMEDTIYEDEPPQALRPASRASKESSYRSITPRQDFETSPKISESASQHYNSPSEYPSERRPVGPRSPSPLPKTPLIPPTSKMSPPNFDHTVDDTLLTNPITSTAPSQPLITTPIPRSKRQPFFPTGHTDATPKPSINGTPAPPNVVEPLSIKKKTSVRASVPLSPTFMRAGYTRNSPMSRTSARIVSPKRTSPQIRNKRTPISLHDPFKGEHADQLIQIVRTTKEDVELSRRAIKRIKLEVEGLQSTASRANESEHSRPSSPDKGTRTPQRSNPPMTKAAQERLIEMRQLISKRQGENTPRIRQQSVPDEPSASRGTAVMEIDAFVTTIEDLASEADRGLARASLNQDTLQSDLERLAADFKEKLVDLEKTRIELQNTKRQCELVKSLLADATTEKEIMYEAFNEELDGMYNDANLPEDEAWTAMSSDLRYTKEARNALTKENSQLKRRLAESDMQKEEWGALLRSHGLIP